MRQRAIKSKFCLAITALPCQHVCLPCFLPYFTVEALAVRFGLECNTYSFTYIQALSAHALPGQLPDQLL